MQQKLLDISTKLMDKAKAKGADAVIVSYKESQSLSQSQRLGKLEELERSESQSISLRVYDGKKYANVSSSDSSDASLDILVDRAMAMARSVPENEYEAIADPEQILKRDIFADDGLDLYDDYVITEKQLATLSQEAETAMLDIAGVTNSHGAGASWGMSQGVHLISNGYQNFKKSSHFSIGAAAVAGENLGMETDGDHDSQLHFADLRDAAAIGKRAGERAVAKLNARKIQTCEMPVIFDKRISSGLLGHLIGAISGAAIARKSSFLQHKMGENILPNTITIIDDPAIKRGFGSRLADSEGLPCHPINFVDKGVLASWILDLPSARQLHMASNACAGGVRNCYIPAGTQSLDDIMRDIGTGILVTQLMGQGVNGVTGDYSRGASGFMIEHGQISYPISEITIASNLLDMYASMIIANDLEFKSKVNAPSILIDNMKIAGI